LKNSYGPDGSMTAIRKPESEQALGTTAYTKDGHTILSNIKMSRPIEVSTIDDLKDITRDTVKKVGDGTTSAVLLSYAIFKALLEANKQFHISEQKLVEDLKVATKKLCELIQSNGRDVSTEDIYEIAYTSTNGNDEVALSIASIYKDFGKDVWIDVGINNSDDNIVKSYEGLTFDSGYFNAGFINNAEKNTCEIRDPEIYVFEDPIDTLEMYSFINAIMKKNIAPALSTNSNSPFVPTVIFSPGFGNDIRTIMDQFLSYFTAMPAASKPPFLFVTNIHRPELLSDLAVLSGAKMIKKYIDPNIQNEDIEKGLAPTLETVFNFAGKAELVVADVKKTKVINPKLMHNEDGSYSRLFTELVSSLEASLHNLEETKADITSIYKLKRRIESLKCNMVDYLVGGIAITDRDAVKDAVEDAVLNCRSAAKYGVGFGANFEAFRAANALCCKELNAMEEKDRIEVINGKKYNIYNVLANAYMELCALIYSVYCDGNMSSAYSIIKNSLSNSCPFNLRTKQYDGKVLSSIKSDQVIIEAISKIVGMMFVTNQYLTQSPEFNVYEELN
jgi:chaperonin GroEL